jgi:hypothetical protein
MRRFSHVDIEVFVKENRTADPGDADGPLPKVKLVEGLGHEAVNGSVMAARAEMKGYVLQTLGALKDLLHKDNL